LRVAAQVHTASAALGGRVPAALQRAFAGIAAFVHAAGTAALAAIGDVGLHIDAAVVALIGEAPSAMLRALACAAHRACFAHGAAGAAAVRIAREIDASAGAVGLGGIGTTGDAFPGIAAFARTTVSGAIAAIVRVGLGIDAAAVTGEPVIIAGLLALSGAAHVTIRAGGGAVAAETGVGLGVDAAAFTLRGRVASTMIEADAECADLACIALMRAAAAVFRVDCEVSTAGAALIGRTAVAAGLASAAVAGLTGGARVVARAAMAGVERRVDTRAAARRLPRLTVGDAFAGDTEGVAAIRRAVPAVLGRLAHVDALGAARKPRLRAGRRRRRWACVLRTAATAEWYGQQEERQDELRERARPKRAE